MSSGTCWNNLYVRGDSDKVSKFFDFIKEKSDIGEYFVNLEKSVEDEGVLDALDLSRYGCDSNTPWKDTFEVDIGERKIFWESGGYPSILAVYKLSKDFPDIDFFFEIDNTEDELEGWIAIRDGNISNKHFVYFEDGAIDVLFGNYGKEMMSLKVDEKIEVGIGMVEVECTGEEDAESEIIKKFNVVFQCDESPKIIVHVTKEDYDDVSLDMDFMNGDWSLDEIEYSDDDGNEDTTEGSYNGEMCVHADKTPEWWEEGLKISA